MSSLVRNSHVWAVLITSCGILLWRIQVMAQPAPPPLPDAVTSALAAIQKPAAEALPPPGAFAALRMRLELQAKKGPTSVLLAEAKQSPQKLSALSAIITGTLSSFSSAYGPGATIDPQLLAKTRFYLGEYPDNGIAIQCYLLLQMSDLAKEARFTKLALTACFKAAEAESYLGQQRFLAQVPGAHKELERWGQGFQGCITDGGGNIAWCCDEFMLKVAATPDAYGYLGSGGQSIAAQYAEWRLANRMTDATAPMPDYLQFDILAWVQKLMLTLAER